MRGRFLAAAGLISAAFVLGGAAPVSLEASSAPAIPVLTGSVVGTTIQLKDPDGLLLNEFHGLPAGTYTVEIDDNEMAHNFHLSGGPITDCTGESACLTGVNETGHFTWTVTFQPSQGDQDFVKYVMRPARLLHDRAVPRHGRPAAASAHDQP